MKLRDRSAARSGSAGVETISGMSVVHDVVDDAGRHGVAVGVSDGAGQADLGSREVVGAQKGTLSGRSTGRGSFQSTCRGAWHGWDGIETVGQPVKGDRDPPADRSVRGVGGIVADWGVGEPGTREVAGRLGGHLAKAEADVEHRRGPSSL